jgi:hypothetical protein
MSEFDDALVSAYQRQGLLTADRAAVRLSTACPRASLCWADEAAARHPAPDMPAAALSAPHVGRRYKEARLLVLLENLFDYGGFDLGPNATVGMRFLADHARTGFGQGHKVLFRGDGYSGTRVWYQATAYAGAWLAQLGLLEAKWVGRGELAGANLADALDLVAFAQHVKCSPAGARSHQNAAMWSECGRHVLAEELDVLRPERLLVVGTGDNAGAVREHVLPGDATVICRKTVKVGRRTVLLQREERITRAGGRVEVVCVPHPAMPGGASRALVEAVRELLAV